MLLFVSVYFFFVCSILCDVRGRVKVEADVINSIPIWKLKKCLLCISNSFQLLRAPKSWSKYFYFSRFQPFFFFSNLFQSFHVWSHWKTSENEQKNVYVLLFCYPSMLVDMQTLVYTKIGYLKIIFLGWFSYFLNVFLSVKWRILVKKVWNWWKKIFVLLLKSLNLTNVYQKLHIFIFTTSDGCLDGSVIQKWLKTAEKSVLTSFRVRTAPKSWLKYTTSVVHRFRKQLLTYLFSPIIN